MKKSALFISEGRQREREKMGERGGQDEGEKQRLHRLNLSLMKDTVSPQDEQKSMSHWHG